MSPPSIAAGLQLERRRAGWVYSTPLAALDLIWSLAFVGVSCSVLLSTAEERPPTPLRFWILGYALHCLVHVGFVWFECAGRRSSGRVRWVVEVGVGVTEEEMWETRQIRFVKKLESMSLVASLLWWFLGFYWIVLGGQALAEEAPRLYWLAVVFLAFDVFFAAICVTLSCIIGLALCCCLPCIVAILYAVAGQGGASDADINSLPKFRFHKVHQSEVTHNEHFVSLATTQKFNPMGDLSSASPEDSECCICLSQYEDGADLRSLPCSHCFHSGCIVKWLRINATCPLCKYNIRKGDEQV